MGIKEKLGFGSDSLDDISEEELKKLEKRKRKLERKARIKRMKEQLKEMEVEDSGLLGKLGGMAKDLTKEGHNRALNHLVGPPESAVKTQMFVTGSDIVKRNKGTVSDFLLGDNNPEREKDIGIDFPIKTEDGVEDLDVVKSDITEV